MSGPHFNQKAAQEAFLASLAKSFNNPAASPDLRIQCDGQEWLCHKHILTRQSEWFVKACHGAFKESKAHTIELHDDDKDAVGAMLEFCYAFTYTDQQPPIFHIRVFALAEKYFVPGLAQLAADNFSAQGLHASTSLDDITNAIAEAHTAVYDQGSMLRLATTSLIMLKADSLLSGKHPDFDALMDSHPTLAADVARGMAKTWQAPTNYSTQPAMVMRPYRCPNGIAHQCGAGFVAAISPNEMYVHHCADWKIAFTKKGAQWANYMH